MLFSIDLACSTFSMYSFWNAMTSAPDLALAYPSNSSYNSKGFVTQT